MSGVSYSAGDTNLDLDALIKGGDAFLARVQAIKAAKDEHDKAYDRLNLGHSAAAVYADAQATVSNAQKAADDIRLEAEKALSDAREAAAAALASAKDDASKAVADASAEAAAILARANAAGDALNQDIATGRQALSDWAEKTKAEANAIMQAAVAKQTEVDKQIADNAAAAKTLAAAEKEARTVTAKAEALQKSLEKKLDAIKTAVS